MSEWALRCFTLPCSSSGCLGLAHFFCLIPQLQCLSQLSPSQYTCLISLSKWALSLEPPTGYPSLGLACSLCNTFFCTFCRNHVSRFCAQACLLLPVWACSFYLLTSPTQSVLALALTNNSFSCSITSPLDGALNQTSAWNQLIKMHRHAFPRYLPWSPFSPTATHVLQPT